MNKLSLQFRILLGRFLTRSGDQAWDFAVPIVLLKIYPDQIRIAALYYLLSKLVTVLLLPKMSSMIDRISRLSAAKFGIFLQLIGVVVGGIAICMLHELGLVLLIPEFLFYFVLLVTGGFLSNLGSSFMDIAIANDLVPSSLEERDLPKFNSRLRQIDLFTEVTSPIIAGLLLILEQPLLFGFYLVALWNIVSFFPEIALIKSVLKDRPELLGKRNNQSVRTSESLFQKIVGGWSAFFRDPIALVAVAYAFLWLSVLSPHGVLLAAFLKDGWQLPEWAIGIFRGAGAFFGLLATAIFPWAERKWGLLIGTRNFIIFQTGTLLVGLAFFAVGGLSGQIGFLVFILFSRIGLYGFSLGEMQIRQLKINPASRGEVNGFATALTGIATLVLFAVGALLPSTKDFAWLVFGSVSFVAVGCVTYIIWLRKSV